ncbi:MAG TPA: hypothetical protein DEQ87_10955 [Algoriphagus sp.]|jgi:hypothetical protein|uniref:hypothetical protein n=2 Tax=Cyclobacteriaceae TaxID=563798 RepID=UPI000C3AE0F5|nr:MULTISPECIES: hypothetical protein [Algoriphagus]MAL12063.1 hypothetical protein [Algoriphagus sp.]MAN87084.1 hypothetical protein [Algoriphagus sp.]HAD50172.1 hypothetical protein [Algoriphagus sp.]HAZ24248.1 hypothetical protein [Algoriphagus sp.]HCB46143.1 hypothetical protein [Algoriphagus sp.]|tara:strand:+ start:2679 stop:3425 length:747 start_codon:yes stop_codon:yes gene_type:complete
MARQSSFLKLEGTIGDITFYKGRTGFKARQKGGVSKDRILKDPKFRRTRENLQEFARAANAAKFLKDAFRGIALKSSDGSLHNRLYSIATKVIYSDTLSNRGERRFELGNIQLMKGFQFSNQSTIENTLFKQPQISDEPDSVTVTIQAMVPATYLRSLVNTTHYRISLIRASINFVDGTYSEESVNSGEIPISMNEQEELALTLPKPSIPDTHHFFAMALEYLQVLENGSKYDLYDLTQNPATILVVS